MRGRSRYTPDEYGREAAEQADYGLFQVKAVRYKDTTGAYAASLEARDHPIQVDNYLIACSGKCPNDLATLAKRAAPHLPCTAADPQAIISRRRTRSPILSATSWARSACIRTCPRSPIPPSPSTLGPKANLARYRLSKGEATLAVFSYPTLEMARQQTPAYEKIPGVVVKRTGSLVALVASAGSNQEVDPEAAKKLLSQVNYRGAISFNEPLPLVIKPETAAQMILAIMTLAGYLLVFCLVSGLAYGAIRVVARRFGYSGAQESMTTLDLGGK